MAADNLQQYTATTLNQIKSDAAAIANIANTVSKATATASRNCLGFLSRSGSSRRARTTANLTRL
jgi:hypothetical protein